MVPGTYPGEWDIPDETPAEAGQGTTEVMDGLADPYADCRDEHQEPPQLPRFGPPPAPRPGE